MTKLEFYLSPHINCEQLHSYIAFSQSVDDLSLSICYLAHEQTARCIFVLPLCFSMMNVTFSDTDNEKKETIGKLVNKNESAVKKKSTESDTGNAYKI